jgi:hypothetical protein
MTGAGIEETEAQMMDRMKRAWRVALAVAPFVAIALVEGAMRRW